MTIPGFAQRGGGGARGGGGGISRGGAGGFRSSGSGFRSGGGFRGSYGFRGGSGFRGGYGGFRNYGYYPLYYGWSGFYGGGYDSYYGSNYSPYAYNNSYYSAPAPYYQPSAPIVVVNEGSAYPERNYQQPRYAEREPSPAQQTYQPPIYSIAFRDGRVVEAVAYWVMDRTIHYVTLDHAMHQAPLAEVDKNLSLKLNRDNNVEFRLPQPPAGSVK